MRLPSSQQRRRCELALRPPLPTDVMLRCSTLMASEWGSQIDGDRQPGRADDLLATASYAVFLCAIFLARLKSSSSSPTIGSQ